MACPFEACGLFLRFLTSLWKLFIANWRPFLSSSLAERRLAYSDTWLVKVELVSVKFFDYCPIRLCGLIQVGEDVLNENEVVSPASIPPLA